MKLKLSDWEVLKVVQYLFTLHHYVLSLGGTVLSPALQAQHYHIITTSQRSGYQILAESYISVHSSLVWWPQAAQIHNSVRNLDMETESEACWCALFILLSQLQVTTVTAQVMKCKHGFWSPLSSALCAGVYHLQKKAYIQYYSILGLHSILF